MALSRQEGSPTSGGRQNQRARTRAALLTAAVELVRDGQEPSMPEAAERALMSVATAYRYFPTAEALWEEASLEAADFIEATVEIETAIEAAGDDVRARVDALVRAIGWRMLDDQVIYRRMAKAGLDAWFAQQRRPEPERMPVRAGRRNRFNRFALRPLEGVMNEVELEHLVAALGTAWGSEAVISLIDVCGLDVEQAKEAMLQSCRWILAGALAGSGGPAAG